MTLIIMYWAFSALYIVGMNDYNNDNSLSDWIFAITLGWLIMPISLGTKRAYEIDLDKRKNEQKNSKLWS
jgi:hypothetical protein